ncbi:hypothetical protein RRG08_015652 [Elysia crispata]|uniref:Uncharacterized protein n=1 Tax=Elysia crispata TaxID=231223 RepID=A0AAE0XSD1_9GAST|nr:hypothetical protein RRG08_015652 [Elysia crispata]
MSNPGALQLGQVPIGGEVESSTQLTTNAGQTACQGKDFKSIGLLYAFLKPCLHVPLSAGFDGTPTAQEASEEMAGAAEEEAAEERKVWRLAN